VVRDVGTPRDGDPLIDDQADGQGRGDAVPAVKARAPRQRRTPVTEKGKGRNLKIPDGVYRRLTLEARRRGTDASKLVTKILDRELPANIRIVVDDEKPPAAE
jgi:hypothetical protein